MGKNAYTLNEFVSATLTESVCYRPMLYTVDGSLEEIYSFISAVQHFNNKSDAEREISDKAMNWLLTRSEMIESKVNFSKIRLEFVSDSEAISALSTHLQSK